METLIEMVQMYLSNVTKILESKTLSDAELLYVDGQLYACVQYVHGWLRTACGKVGPKREYLSKDTPLKDLLAMLKIELPSTLTSATAFGYDSYINTERPRQVFHLGILGEGTVRRNAQRVIELMQWLIKSETIDSLVGGASSLAANAVVVARENDIKASKPLLLLAQSDSVLEKDNPCIATIVRSRVLWDLALIAETNWVDLIPETTERYRSYREYFEAYARTVCLRSGFYHFGFGPGDIYFVTKKGSQLYGAEYPQYIDRFDPVAVAGSRVAFRNTVCNLALLDMPEGASLLDYTDKVLQSMYLVLNYYLKNAPDKIGILLKYSANLFPEQIVKGKLQFNTIRDHDYALNDVVAFVDKPKFERYRDKTYRYKSHFDYITVEVSLVHKYGRTSLAIARKHSEELKALIMQKIAQTPQIKKKPEFLDFLYVKEITACGGGYTLSALVEFKPGLEGAAASEPGHVQPMDLK